MFVLISSLQPGQHLHCAVSQGDAEPGGWDAEAMGAQQSPSLIQVHHICRAASGARGWPSSDGEKWGTASVSPGLGTMALLAGGSCHGGAQMAQRYGED